MRLRLTALAMTGLLSTACGGYSEGELSKFEIPAAALPALPNAGAKVVLGPIENGAAVAAVKSDMEESGLTTTTEPIVLTLFGVNGGKVNGVYATSSEYTRLRGSNTFTRNLGGGQLDSGRTEAAADYYHTTLVNSYYRMVISEKYGEGPGWKEIANAFITALGLTSYGNLPDSLNGRDITDFEVPASGTFVAGSITINTQECVRPGKQFGQGNVAADEVYYNNRVCELHLSYRPEIATGIYAVAFKDILRAKYRELYGEPDCWMDLDFECGNREVSDIIGAMQSKSGVFASGAL